MLPMLPMQRVSGSGRALSAALLSRECIMWLCSRDCGSHAVSRSSTAELACGPQCFTPALTPATATGWMQAPQPERSLGA